MYVKYKKRNCSKRVKNVVESSVVYCYRFLKINVMLYDVIFVINSLKYN